MDIVYEDDDVIVVNKDRGMVTHPAAGNFAGTLVNALLYHCTNLSGINGVIRPGIVHRLDKDTSGLLVCAKNDKAHLSLSRQIQSKLCRRLYIAIVRGNVKEDEGCIETLIARSKTDRKKMGPQGRHSLQSFGAFRKIHRGAMQFRDGPHSSDQSTHGIFGTSAGGRSQIQSSEDRLQHQRSGPACRKARLLSSGHGKIAGIHSALARRYDSYHEPTEAAPIQLTATKIF